MRKNTADQHQGLIFTKIQDSGKIEKIVDALKGNILSGRLKPGSKLPAERELASSLGVSRFSLREALRVAQAEGLIEIRRGSKPTVTEPTHHRASQMINFFLQRSEKDLVCLVEARQALEIQIARLAARRAKKAHFDAMAETIQSMEDNRADIDRCIDEDFKFHDVLTKASGNFVFEIMLGSITDLLRESRRKTLQSRGLDRTIRGHKAILGAVRARNPDLAGATMLKHLKVARRDIKEGHRNRRLRDATATLAGRI